ncbi:MAG TPA: hypothetical protein VHC93_24500, partial [Methylomirabilota bacterium]|nr:hypothetical protein [Methylomirabilota bacterium]
DRDDDHQLDEGEAALVAQHLTVPEPVHCSSSWKLVALRPSMEVELLLAGGNCRFDATGSRRNSVN